MDRCRLRGPNGKVVRRGTARIQLALVSRVLKVLAVGRLRDAAEKGEAQKTGGIRTEHGV